LVTDLHKFPLSRGRVLRHIGEDIERVVELIVENRLDEIAAYKEKRTKDGKIGKRSHPGRIRGVAKRQMRKAALRPSWPETAPQRVLTATPPQPIAPEVPQAVTGGLELNPTQKRPYSVTLPDGTVVTYT
jgi:hypothetical protein